MESDSERKGIRKIGIVALCALAVLLVVNYYLGTRPSQETAATMGTQATIRALAKDKAFIETLKASVGELPSGAVIYFTRPCTEIEAWSDYHVKGTELPLVHAESTKDLYLCEKK